MVRRGEEIIAAKIYLERHRRSFRHNIAYREGRLVRNTRTQRAMQKKSQFGQAAAEEAWKSSEADALYRLDALGVRVPKPVFFHEGVLLMELVIDPGGYPAPRLVDAPIAREAARSLYEDLRQQVIRMLCADVIHADLSPFNVLLAWNGPTLIDFPQAIAAAHNSRAEQFLKRDIENLRRFFAEMDPTVKGLHNDSHEIWRAYVRRELTPDFVPQTRPVPWQPTGVTPHRRRQPQKTGRSMEANGPVVSYRETGRTPRAEHLPRSHPAAQGAPAVTTGAGPGRGRRRRRRR
jgi:RIO kinase 1